MGKNLSQIFEKYNFDSNIYFSPRIPEKKLNNAVAAYASMSNQNDVILLLDETVFGSAKDGLLLTPQGLFCHEMYTDPKFFHLCDINDIWAEKKDIYVNQTKFFACNILDKKYIQPLCWLLMELVQALRGNNSDIIISTESTLASQTEDSNATCDTLQSNIENIQTESNSSCSIDKEFEEIVSKFSFGNEKIFFAPRIPGNKLSNALSAYAPQTASSEVLMLLDDTLMGGAKEGAVLTKSQLFFHEFLTDPVVVKLADIQSIEAKGKSIVINGKQVFKITQFDKSYLSALAHLINEVATAQLISNLSDEELAERALVKELSQRPEYFFLTLFRAIPQQHRIDAIYNSIEIFFSQFGAISQKQKNEAWDRDSQEENEVNEALAMAAHSILRLTFELPLSISKRFNNNKVSTHIVMSDCVVHELLLYFFIRGSQLIADAFKYDNNRDFYLELYAKKIFCDRILIPFYNEKVLQCDSINSLKKVALQNDLSQVFKDIVERRKFLRRTVDNISFVSGGIRHRIEYGLYFLGGQCSLESLIASEHPQEVEIPQVLKKHCKSVLSSLEEDMEQFLISADGKLEKILAKVFS